MAITEQNPWSMPMADLRQVMEAESRAAEKPAEIQQLEKSFADFTAACPDFQNTPDNVNALMSHIAWNRVPTVDDLTQAHALASYRNQYKVAQEPQRPTVAPEDAYKVDLNVLGDAVFGFPEKTEWNMPLDDLARQAGISEGPKHDPAWSMDINELKEKAGIS